MNERLNAIVGARITEFRKRMSDVQKTIRELPNRTKLKITVVTKEAEKRINNFQSKMDRLSSSIHALGNVGANMVGGSLLMMSPGLIPVLASAVGLIGTLGPMLAVAGGGAMGLATAFGLAGAGAVAFGAVAVSNLNEVFSASSDLKKLQEELAVTTDLKERKKIMEEISRIQGSLNGEQTKALKSLQDMQGVWSGIMKKLEKPTVEIFTKAMSSLSDVLKMAEPTFVGATTAVNNLMDSLAKQLKTADVKAFFDWMGKSAGPMLETLGKAGMNVMLGFMNLTRGFDPLAQSMSQGLLGMTQRFAEWTSTVIKSKGFQNFISYIQTNGPKLLSIIGNVVSGLIGVFSAFSPLASDMMTGLQDLTGRFKKWGNSLSENKQFQKFIGYIRDNAPTVMSLIGNIVTTLINFGVSIAPIGQKVLEIANSFFAWTSKMLEAHPWLGKVVAGVIMMIGAFQMVIPAILGLATLFPGLGMKIIGLLPKIASLAGTLLRFAGGPIGLVIQAVIMLAVIIWKNWDSIKAWTIKVWNAIKDFLLSAWESIKTSVSSVWNSIKSFFTETLSNIWNAVKQKFSDIVNSVRDKMTEAWNKVEEIWGKIQSFFDGIDLFESGKAIIQSAIDGLMSMKRKILGKVEDIVGAVRDFWPFSPAKVGPLSDIHKMDFGGPISTSINKAKSGVARSMENLAAAARTSFAPNIALADIGGSVNIGANIKPNAPVEYESRSTQEDLTNAVSVALESMVIDNKIAIGETEFIQATGKPILRYIENETKTAGRRGGHVR